MATTAGRSTTSRAWILSTGQDGKCTVNSEVARRVLEPHRRRKCNLISIFGAARQGKSFLMNCLAGQDGIFRISNAQDPCTQGIDISNTLMTVQQFSEVHGGLRTDSDNLVGFVDAEGQGDRDERYDANLVCPILLCSKSIIFNWKDSLQRDRMLKLLGVMQKAALSVNPSSATSTRIFGHLHIVFRDWQYEGNKESVYNTLFARERSADHDAIVRNSIRETLLDSFESINIWLFPSPSSDTRRELTFARTTLAFQHAVQSLRERLAEDLSTSTKFNGRSLTCQTIPPLVEGIVELLNSGQAIQPESAYTSMLRAEGTRSREAFESQIREVISRWEEECVAVLMEEVDFESNMKKDLEEILSMFRGEISHLLDADVTNALHKDLFQPLQNLATDLQAAAMLRYHDSVRTHLRTARENAENLIRKQAKEFQALLPREDDALEAFKQQLKKAASKELVRTAGIISDSPAYKESAGQLKAVVADAIAKLQAENAELLRQNENQVHEVLSTYNAEFEAYWKVLNTDVLPAPNELPTKFEGEFAAAARRDFDTRFKAQPTLYSRVQGHFEHKIQECREELQRRYLASISNAAETFKLQAINEITMHVIEITPTQHVLEPELRAQLDQLIQRVGTEHLAQFAPWWDSPATQASELGLQACTYIDASFHQPLLQHKEVLWRKLSERNQQLYTQPQVKMEIAKPKAVKAAPAKATATASTVMKQKVQSDTSFRLGVGGAKITKSTGKKPAKKQEARPSTPPLQYGDESTSESEDATTTKPTRSARQPKPAEKKASASRAKTKPSSSAKATPTKRGRQAQDSDAESDISFQEDASESEEETMPARRQVKAVRRKSTPQRRDMQAPSDDEDDDQLDEERVQPGKSQKLTATGARRQSAASSASSRRKSAPAAGGADDVVAAAREAAKAEAQQRADRAAVAALGGPSPGKATKRARR